MALFSRYALTDNGKALIAKSHIKNTGISFTRAATGSGIWEDGENLEVATKLKNEKQTFPFSSIQVIAGNDSTVILTVDITNEKLNELYILNEMGIFATDPDKGEILYAISIADSNTVAIPANNSVGISDIVEKITIEVANAKDVTIETSGAHVTADEFERLKKIVNLINEGLSKGEAGQYLFKKSEKDADYGWVDSNTWTSDRNSFPEEGRTNAVYIDTESSELYVWKLLVSGEYGYFKLPLGAEASETLQKQITENANAIVKMNSETKITVNVSDWKAATENGVTVYTAEKTLSGMTAETNCEIWPYTISTDADAIVSEMEARGLFFGQGRSYSADGKLVLKCYKEAPSAAFGILLKGFSS